MKTYILITFIRFSLILFFSEVQNQELPTQGKRTDSILLDNIIKNPVKEAIRLKTEELNQRNDSISNQIKKTKKTFFVLQLSNKPDKEKKQLKTALSEKEKEIDSLKKELEEKDALIVEQVYASIKSDSTMEAVAVKDSFCVRWGFLTKRIPENCTKWKQLETTEE